MANGVGKMTSCSLCKSEIPLVFLEKIEGTYVKDEKGKRHPICASCQKANAGKDLAKLLG